MLAEICTKRLHEEEATPPPPNVPKMPRSLRTFNSRPAPPLLPPSGGPTSSDFRLHPHVRPTGKKVMPISTSGSNAFSSSARSPAASRSCPSPSSAGSPVQRFQSWVEEHVRLRGSPPHELGEKQIENSDTVTNQSRLLIPKNMLKHILDYATEPERQSIHSDHGLEVSVLDSVGRRYRMMCKVRSSHSGVFNGPGWNAYVGYNSLTCGHKLCVMAFRANYEGYHCFAFL